MASDFILDSDEHGEFCVIPLSGQQGKFFAKIDCCDFDDIGSYNWHLWSKSSCKTKYAIRNTRKNGRNTTIKMHRQILGVKEGVFVDHIDGDGLNNRRYNLRIATHTQNQWNMRPRGGTSQYKGVCWHIRYKVWTVNLRYFKRRIWIAQFHKEIVNGVDIGEIRAAKAYDQAARKYFGVFARLNFPTEDEKEALRLIIAPHLEREPLEKGEKNGQTVCSAS